MLSASPIYMMWYQGLKEAPDMIRRINRIWTEMHGPQSVHLVSGQEVDDLISAEGIDPTSLTMQVRSNLVRLILLADRGGIWADATMLPSVPVGTWLDEHLVRAHFFAFTNRHRDRLISSWFLGATPDSLIAKRWREIYVDYFRSPRRPNKKAPLHVRMRQELRRMVAPASFARKDVAGRSEFYPYHVLHYHFEQLLKTRADCAAEWKKVRKVSSAPAGRLKSACAKSSGNLGTDRIADLFSSFPIHKLNWRKPEIFSKVLDFAERRVSLSDADRP
ncbi:capsular polysaccharide synthesis protein [Ostreiculturibacter nitratireducens]|uniref:capsular polysaccharide synthesis protein n=1 Tax=Ostreiculturibacter nitratireducens TaxID=3075226 RepID=UPI0031B597DA